LNEKLNVVAINAGKSRNCMNIIQGNKSSRAICKLYVVTYFSNSIDICLLYMWTCLWHID